MYFYPSSTDTLVPALVTTQGHSLTWVSAVSFPAPPPTAQGHSPNRASHISVPLFWIPSMNHCLSLDPTVWISLHVASSSLLPMKLLPGFPKVASLSLLGSTKLPYFFHPAYIPSHLHTLLILVATPPTMPRLPVVSLYRSFLTTFMTLPALLLPWLSPMSRLLSTTLTSLWFVWEKPRVILLPYSPLPPKGPKYPNYTVILLVSPSCKKFPTPWGLTLFSVSVSPASPRLNLCAWDE